MTLLKSLDLLQVAARQGLEAADAVLARAVEEVGSQRAYRPRETMRLLRIIVQHETAGKANVGG